MREGGGLCWGPSGRVVAHRLPKPWQLFVITTVDLTMAALNKLIHALQAYPSVQCSLNTNQLFLFIDLCCHLRQELLYTPGSSLAIPPLRLPDNIRQFLVLCLFPSKTSNCLSIIVGSCVSFAGDKRPGNVSVGTRSFQNNWCCPERHYICYVRFHVLGD